MEDTETYETFPVLQSPVEKSFRELEADYLEFVRDLFINNTYDGTSYCPSGHHYKKSVESGSCVFCQDKREQMTRIHWKYFWFVSKLPSELRKTFSPRFEVWWYYEGRNMMAKVKKMYYSFH
jgi:TFIIF-interacting CTD phosphatase-like protein